MDCKNISFSNTCHECSELSSSVPIKIRDLEVFNYQPSGFFDSMFKSKKQEELNNLRDKLVNDYKEMKEPYFNNLIELPIYKNNKYGENRIGLIKIFTKLLLNLNMNSINKVPGYSAAEIVDKLVVITEFKKEYNQFENNFKNYLKESFEDTLKNYINEVGTGYKDKIPLILYFFVDNDYFSNSSEVSSLKTRINQFMNYDNTIKYLTNIFDEIHEEIIMERLLVNLENYDRENDQYIDISYIDYIDGLEFEDFLAEMFEKIGFKTERTKKTGDQGADLFIYKNGVKTVIQAKNYQDKVNNKAVQEAFSAKRYYNCNKAMVITNNYYTESAKDLAEGTDVELVDRNGLINYLDKYNEIIIKS